MYRRSTPTKRSANRAIGNARFWIFLGRARIPSPSQRTGNRVEAANNTSGLTRRIAVENHATGTIVPLTMAGGEVV